MKKAYHVIYIGRAPYVFRDAKKARDFLHEQEKIHDFRKIVKRDAIGDGVMICYRAQD